MGAPHSKTIAALLGPAWGNASLRQVSRLLLFGLCSIFLVTITSDNWAISTAHLPGNAESPTASGPAPSFSSSFAPVHSKPKVTQATEDLSNSAHNADDTRTLEILSNLYTHMQKYQHNSPSVSLASSSSEPNSSPNQDHHQLLAIQEFLNNMDQTAKQANPKVPNYAVNFKKNGKTMNADELSKGGSAVGSSADQTVATPYYSPQSDSNGNGSGPNKQLKHSPYTSMTAASEQQRVEETTRDEAQMVNKFLANLGPPPASVQRKGMSNEVKASGIISGAGVGPPMASSVTNGMPSESQGLYELLASIDGRVQKLQDSLMYYRNAPKPPMVHSSLNPIFTNYLSLIKAQVLNIESTIEAKFSNIEHKFSNVEIEDGIWKKTINWKLEEITSKLSQNENKLSFSNDQILNKLDLVERNFQIVTNDFFSKFLLVNEKLNKIELTLQTKLNDLEAKLRNSFTADNSFKAMQKMTSHGLYKPTEIEPSIPEHNFKEAVLPVQTFQPEKTPKATTPSSNQVTESMTGSTTRKNVDQSEKSTASVASKLTWNKASMMKTNNTVASLSDRIKFAQRFLKLINAKTNQTLLTKNKFNSTTILDSLKASAEAAKMNGGFQNDAPIVEPTKSVNTSVQSNSAGTFDNLSGQMNNSTAKQSSDKPTQPAKLASQDNYRLMQAETAAPMTTPSAPKKDITQAGGFNNRNLDGLASINYQDANRGNASSGGYVQTRGKPENGDANRNTAKCDQLRSIFTNIPRESQQESKFYSLCYKMLESNGSSNSLHDFVMASSLDRETTQMDSREATLEKRELNEEIIFEAPRESPPSLSESRPTTTLLDETNNEIKMDRMDDLDSKLQFFSTKIIKIVQEMWLSSQASENYLKQSLQVANKTQILLKDGFEKLQLAVKPVNQMNQLAEEIREPIINRLQELSTALNNSVEVILNTQAEFITRVLQTDEELKVYEVLDYFINEYRNKSSNGLLQIQNSLHQQSGQFNRSLEFLLLKLETVSKKTIEGVRSETLKVLDNVKDDLHSQISSLSSAHTGSSTRNGAHRPMDSHSQPGECFISRKEFATFCLDDSKMFGAVETVPVSHQQGDTTGEQQHPVVSADEELANHELHPHELSHMTEPLTPILTPKRVLPTDMERFNSTISNGEITEINNGNES